MKKVVVTTKEGQSIRGIRRFSFFQTVLVEAELLGDETVEAVELEGKIVIPDGNVAMVQVLP